jgi:hypothetical protein
MWSKNTMQKNCYCPLHGMYNYEMTRSEMGSLLNAERLRLTAT